MKRFVWVVAVVLLAAMLVSAASPVGSVSSQSAFTLRGARVPVGGVPNWLLLVGDELATAASAATLSFRDGSRAIVSENSRVRIEEVNGRTVLRLIEGSMAIRSAPSSSMQFFASESALSVRPGVETTASVNGANVRTSAAARVIVPPPPGVPPPASNR